MSLSDQALDLMFGGGGQVADAAEARDDDQTDQRHDHRRHGHLWRHQPLREIDERRLRSPDPAKALQSDSGRDDPVVQRAGNIDLGLLGLLEHPDRLLDAVEQSPAFEAVFEMGLESFEGGRKNDAVEIAFEQY